MTVFFWHFFARQGSFVQANLPLPGAKSCVVQCLVARIAGHGHVRYQDQATAAKPLAIAAANPHSYCRAPSQPRPTPCRPAFVCEQTCAALTVKVSSTAGHGCSWPRRLEFPMSMMSIFPSNQPQTSAWRALWPRGQHELANNLGIGCRCLRDRCTADFSACGGVATGDDVAERLRISIRQPLSALARWIVNREVISFSCKSGLMLPLFQFDFDQGCVRSCAVAALSELTEVMTENEVACWFAQPNTWLDGAVPAQTLLIDSPAVLAAARADRFVAKG